MKRTGDYAPFTHDLRRLAEIARIEINAGQEKTLEEMFTFHIAGRYEGEKLEFYKKYNNAEIAKEWIGQTETLRTWLQTEFQKNNSCCPKLYRQNPA